MTCSDSRDIFQSWKKKSWEFFLSSQQSLKINNPFHFSEEEVYLNNLFHFIFYTSKQTMLEQEQILQYALFISMLLRSTLLFDEAFFIPNLQKKSKIALMQADLFLVQGGIAFSKLKNYKNCNTLLDQTLKTISENYVSSSPSNDLTCNSKLIAKRYGSIFYCSIAGIFLLDGIQQFNKNAYTALADMLGLWVTLCHHSRIKLDGSSKNINLLPSIQLQWMQWKMKFKKESEILRLNLLEL